MNIDTAPSATIQTVTATAIKMPGSSAFDPPTDISVVVLCCVLVDDSVGAIVDGVEVVVGFCLVFGFFEVVEVVADSEGLVDT